MGTYHYHRNIARRRIGLQSLEYLLAQEPREMKVEKHEEGPSAVVQARTQRDERDRDRDRGPRRPRRDEEN